MKKLTLILSLLFLTACSAALPQEARVENRLFIDESSPSLKLEFPFDIEITKQEHTTKYDEQNIAAAVSSYRLSTDQNSKIVFISKMQLQMFGTPGYLSGTDDKMIDNKFFLYKNRYGYCTTFAGAYSGYNIISGEVTRYSGKTGKTTVEIIENLGNDYNFKYLDTLDKALKEKHIGYTQQICSQLLPQDKYQPMPWLTKNEN